MTLLSVLLTKEPNRSSNPNLAAQASQTTLEGRDLTSDPAPHPPSHMLGPIPGYRTLHAKAKGAARKLQNHLPRRARSPRPLRLLQCLAFDFASKNPMYDAPLKMKWLRPSRYSWLLLPRALPNPPCSPVSHHDLHDNWTLESALAKISATGAKNSRQQASTPKPGTKPPSPPR